MYIASEERSETGAKRTGGLPAAARPPAAAPTGAWMASWSDSCSRGRRSCVRRWHTPELRARAWQGVSFCPRLNTRGLRLDPQDGGPGSARAGRSQPQASGQRCPQGARQRAARRLAPPGGAVEKKRNLRLIASPDDLLTTGRARWERKVTSSLHLRGSGQQERTHQRVFVPEVLEGRGPMLEERLPPRLVEIPTSMEVLHTDFPALSVAPLLKTGTRRRA